MTEVKTAVKISVAQAPELEKALKSVLETEEKEISFEKKDIASVRLAVIF